MPGTLHITYSGIGGMAEACLTLVAAAVEAGGEHHVLFHGVEELPPRYEERCQSLGVGYRYIAKRTLISRREFRKIAAYLDDIQPDLVISHMPQAVFAIRKYRHRYPEVKFLSVEHHSNALKDLKRWALTIINHWSADRSVYLTEEYRGQVKKKIGRLLRDNRVAVIPNGIDADLYCPAPDETAPPEILIGMQGRMVAGKDYATLLRAFADLKHDGTVSLELAGDGPMRGELEQLADSLGIRNQVTFHGMLTQEELISRMQKWSVFVLCTHGETMSRALMEAQACGLPVIASNVSGVTAAISPGSTGLLITPRSPASLTEALQKLIQEPEERKLLSSNARKFAVENFSSARSWESYKNLANEI